VVLSLLVTLLLAVPAAAEPVTVKYQEGVTRAFPILRALDGERLAWGDLVQVPRGDRVENRMTFRFKDGSVYDEILTYSQDETFRLLSYRLVQRGPSFPETIVASIDRESGRYHVRYRADEESAEEVLEGRFELGDDVYNGMLSLILKNLPARKTEVTIVAFTPRPRKVTLQLMPLAEDQVKVGDMPLTATRWVIRPQLGLLASLLVVDVPDIRVWIAPGEAPAFVRAEGPLFFMGPVWRIDPY
ncbi:MAG: hypothetical protein ACREM3_07655, partial [Candidatus Rokuibacteriota bacterium]